MFRTYRISVIVCALFVAACGGGVDPGGSGSSGGSDGSGSSTTTGGDSAALDEACAALASATCRRLVSCATFLEVTTFSNTTSCVARKTLQCKSEFSTPEVAKTNVAKLATCAMKLETVSCGDFIDGVLPADCQTDPGTLAEGKACGSDAQCASTLCKKNASGDCGVCAAKIPAGGACMSSDTCGDGLSCFGGKCVTPAAEGAACSDTQPCQALLSCVNMKCGAPAKLGEACSGTAYSCDAKTGALCSPFSNKCEQSKIAKTGEACGVISNDTFVACLGGATCNTGMAAMGSCVAQAADGAACDDTKGIRCLIGASCVNGICQVFDPATCK